MDNSFYKKEDLALALKEHFGHKGFRSKQLTAIQNIMSGENTVVILPTGGGKSICYQLPAVLKDGMAIVVSPLIALMKGQVDYLNKRGIVADFVNSSLGAKKLRETWARVMSEKVKLLYIAPETLNKEDTIALLRTVTISFNAIDEAHCISDWGHDFRPEYRKIRASIKDLGELPVIALTATATPQVRRDIVKNLAINEASVFVSSFNRPNLYYEVRAKNDVHRQIVVFIKEQKEPTGIIYCQSRKKVEEITSLLQNNGIKAAAYHAGLDNKTRNACQDDFFNDKIDVVVATIAFGMGIDKGNIRFVIHHDAPKSLEGYYQETGRAGRDEKPSQCLLFYDTADIRKLAHFNNNKLVTEKAMALQLLSHVTLYAELGVCRRKVITAYFDEDYKDTCNNCDNCNKPTELYEGKSYVSLALRAIQQTGEAFDSDYIIKVLSGTKNIQVLHHKHDSLSVFGKGKKHFSLWRYILEELKIFGYTKVSFDEKRTLSLTEKGAGFLKKSHGVPLRKQRIYIIQDELNKEKAKPLDDTLFKDLMRLREEICKKKEHREKRLRPYMVFSEEMLMGMATTFPTTIEALYSIPGIGTNKATTFGQPFVDLITKYVEEHDIKPAMPIMVRSSSSKPSLTLQIIRQIDRKFPLAAIAKGHNMSLLELLKKMEDICKSGMKLNIDYALDDFLEEEEQEDIYGYLYEDTDDISFEEAYDELCDDYEEEQVRLMYIKYLSEVIN